MSYQHKPGNVKAKEWEERKRRQEAELQRISKIQRFFTPTACSPNADSSLSNIPDATAAEINNSEVCPSGDQELLSTEAELNHESDMKCEFLECLVSIIQWILKDLNQML